MTSGWLPSIFEEIMLSPISYCVSAQESLEQEVEVWAFGEPLRRNYIPRIQSTFQTNERFKELCRNYRNMRSLTREWHRKKIRLSERQLKESSEIFTQILKKRQKGLCYFTVMNNLF